MSLLREAGFVNSLRLKRLTSDIVFLAQNLIMLKTGGELGIILPDSIFNGHEFCYLREDLLRETKINGIIQLPDKIFFKTEARTHILLLEKSKKSNPFITLYKSNEQGELETPIYISKDDALQRMDYSYYHWKTQQKHIDSCSCLGDLGVEIRRGRSSKRDLEKSGVKFFHTSSFPGPNQSVKLENFSLVGEVHSKPGDLLISRVGKRCVGRVTFVEAGIQPISDCIYRLRAPVEFREILWKALASTEGKKWLEVHAHGVCSRCLSKKDLLTFPIPL
jgi:hypothetical protein